MKFTIHAPLVKKRTIAQNTVEVIFDIPDRAFSFIAGQYVTITIPWHDDRPITDQFHNFSITSSPTHSERIVIAFRLSPSAFKTTLLDLPFGTPVTIEGPKGVFVLPPSSDSPLMFIAGGIGITPFMSMIRFLTETKTPQRITLCYFNTALESAAYKKELDALAQENPLITIRYSFGPFDGTLLAEYAEKAGGAEWYAAGPTGMVATVRRALSEYGILDTRIHTEEFSGYEH